MQIFQHADMFKGWFVGDFTPTGFQTPNCEVAVRPYTKGQLEPWHYHKIGTEITYVISGQVKMAGQIVEAGQGIVLDPNEGSAFEALEDSLLCIVKVPSVAGDKYLE